MLLTKIYGAFFILIVSSLSGYAFFDNELNKEINAMLNEMIIPSMVGVGILLFVLEAQKMENNLRRGKLKH